MTPNDIKKDCQARMTKCVDAFRQELTKLRTGRATTALVDHLKVNYYGSDMPLTQVATVVVSDARTLQITRARPPRLRSATCAGTPSSTSRNCSRRRW